jgi:hypothetical protein
MGYLAYRYISGVLATGKLNAPSLWSLFVLVIVEIWIQRGERERGCSREEA